MTYIPTQIESIDGSTIQNGIPTPENPVIPISLEGFERKMTNGDRIRQMTDEELADFILESRETCKLCKKRDEICEGAYHECWNGVDDWLKQEVSEDARTD